MTMSYVISICLLSIHVVSILQIVRINIFLPQYFYIIFYNIFLQCIQNQMINDVNSDTANDVTAEIH